MENHLSWLAYLFWAFMLIFAIVAVSSYGLSIAHYNEYDKEVQDVIQENGGLTSQAQNVLKNYSQQHFKGNFSVKSLSGSDKKPYGSKINYEISGKLVLPFFNIPVHKKTVKGSTISMVRG